MSSAASDVYKRQAPHWLFRVGAEPHFPCLEQFPTPMNELLCVQHEKDCGLKAPFQPQLHTQGSSPSALVHMNALRLSVESPLPQEDMVKPVCKSSCWLCRKPAPPQILMPSLALLLHASAPALVATPAAWIPPHVISSKAKHLL